MLPADADNHLKRLTAEDWSAHYNPGQADSLAEALRKCSFSCQTQEIIKYAVPGEKTLEIGSGSGASSLALAMKGCEVMALDFAVPCLELALAVAQRLGCSIQTIQADAMDPPPFDEDTFDVIFHAGLLEHFTQEERIVLLRNWFPAGKKMISMVPNAASLAYRIGKARQERLGLWRYGLEIPLYSQYSEFRAAGYIDIVEYTIGESHSLNFLPRWHPMRLALKWWLQHNESGDNCGQGYLLVTIGTK